MKEVYEAPQLEIIQFEADEIWTINDSESGA